MHTVCSQKRYSLYHNAAKTVNELTEFSRRMYTLMFLVSTIRATNQMSENMLFLIYTTDTQTCVLRKTSKGWLALPAVNLDKASICGDQKTSFSFWKNRNSYISRDSVCQAGLVFVGPISVGPLTILGLITCMLLRWQHFIFNTELTHYPGFLAWKQAAPAGLHCKQNIITENLSSVFSTR